jgi:hypothetical protein
MHLEYLRSAEKSLPAALNPLAVQSLKIWHCKFTSLAGIAKFLNLERLVVAGYPDSSFEPLSGLVRLRRLELLHFPKATDLSPLASLVALEALSLACLPSWDASCKRLTVKSLSPLCDLPKLSFIELLGVMPADNSLIALSARGGLKSARLSGYPATEAEHFFQATGAINAFLPREAG